MAAFMPGASPPLVNTAIRRIAAGLVPAVVMCASSGTFLCFLSMLVGFSIRLENQNPALMIGIVTDCRQQNINALRAVDLHAYKALPAKTRKATFFIESGLYLVCLKCTSYIQLFFESTTLFFSIQLL
jgi:hypothetical protein